MSIPPPPSRPNRKGPPPAADDVPGALFTPAPEALTPAPEPPKPTRERDTPMNFRVEKEMKRRFKQKAFDLEIDAVELLETMIELYLDDDQLTARVQARTKR